MPWYGWYVIGISALACVLTVWDKRCARRGRWRVPEKTLFIVAALGGAASMLLTMRTVRHKTRHRRFMWGLPLIIAAQTALLMAGHHFAFT